MQVVRKNPKPERFSSALALSKLTDLRLTVMVPVTHLVQVRRKNHISESFSSALALSEPSDLRLTGMVPAKKFFANFVHKMKRVTYFQKKPTTPQSTMYQVRRLVSDQNVESFAGFPFSPKYEM